MSLVIDETYETILIKDGKLILIDQRKLPGEFVEFICNDYRDVEFAIRDMVVRGAPAIGATAAYGVWLAAEEWVQRTSETPASKQKAFLESLEDACRLIESARPTAVNLAWAVRRMWRVVQEDPERSPQEIVRKLLAEALNIHREDVETNRNIAAWGVGIIPDKGTILTHCNTGSLATAGWGTALGVIKLAHMQGKDTFVYADETRPRLQGARLTAWELMQAGIPSMLLPDSAAAVLIRDGKIDCVILGADRIAANGDVCNKIGTFMLSVLCKVYGVPFYCAAPLSTFDATLSDGSAIPIEMRDPSEVTSIGDTSIAPAGMPAFNPAFDVTPHDHVTGIITEVGILRPPYQESIATALRSLNR